MSKIDFISSIILFVIAWGLCLLFMYHVLQAV